VVLGVLALGVVALIALGIASFSKQSGEVMRAVAVAWWVIAATAGVILVWVAAYASTSWGSRRRLLVGAGVGLALGAGYVLLGAELGVVVGLAAGWAVVIPAERTERIIARSVPALLLGLISLPGLTRLAYAGVFVASPWAAALLVLLGDTAWTAVARLRDDEE
jgi:hypothetical protein